MDRYRRGNNGLFLFVIEKFRREYEIDVILVDDPKVHEESAIAGYGAGNSFSQRSYARIACADLRPQARYVSGQ
jgi:hypothetical protein